MQPVQRILHVGLGPLGGMLIREIVARRPGQLVGAVDTAPGLAGRPLSDVVGASELAGLGLAVDGDLEAALDRTRPTIATVTTCSDLPRCEATFATLLRHGVAVVSTCEELSWPWLRHAAMADELDALAREHGGRLLGTGVNPGYVMDALPAFLTAPCRLVRSIRVERIQDASTRRIPFQQKIGAGLTREAFAARQADGSLRHVGLGESLHLIASACGWILDGWDETLEPVIADRVLSSGMGRIEPGQAAGVRQVARGFRDGERLIELEFIASIGQPAPRDRVVIDGDPPLDVTVAEGIHGDVATCAIVINAIDALVAAPAGLHAMTTIRTPSWR